MSTLKQQPYMVEQHIDAPPSYDIAARSVQVMGAPQTALIPHSTAIASTSSPSNNKFKPIVIPQTSKSFRGAFFSPFSRAWAPSLTTHDITPTQFLTFIDGLNESFVAAPAFQVVTMIGGIMTFAPHPITYAGIGLQVGTGLASSATSWVRARAFVKHANETIWGPRGLKVKVLKTKKMMNAVAPDLGEKLQLPPMTEMSGASLSRAEWDSEENDPRMRRMRALGDRVERLEFHGLPEPVEMSNWWKRMGSKQAQKRDAKTQGKLMKKREKAWEEMEKEGGGKEYKRARKYDKEIREIEEEKAEEIGKAEKKLSGRKGDDPKKRGKVEEDLDKEIRKLDHDLEKVLRKKEKKVGHRTVEEGVYVSGKGQEKLEKMDAKEGKIAQKIYWIVIDKAETLDQEVVTEEDVESLESS